MRILHLIYSFNIGEAERMVIALANHQIMNNQVGLCIINNLYSQDLLNELDSQIQIFHINRRKGSHNINDVFLLNWYIFRFHPDILHIHDSDAILYIPVHYLYSTLLTIHATNLPLKGIKQYDQTVAISKAVANITEKRGFHKPKVIYNGILTSAIQQIPQQNRYGEKHFRIIQIGRLEHTIKGQHLLLEALFKLGSPCVTVDFVGSGSSEKYLIEITKKLKLENQVNFLGDCDIKWIYQHLCKYQLLIQPSISEGFGLTIAEGMAANVPVLISNLPGPMEIIGEGKFGYYFKSNDTDDLYLKLKHIITNYKTALNFATKASKYIAANFNFNQTAEQYINIYNESIYKKHHK